MSVIRESSQVDSSKLRILRVFIDKSVIDLFPVLVCVSPYLKPNDY